MLPSTKPKEVAIAQAVVVEMMPLMMTLKPRANLNSTRMTQLPG
jgi:hypothetical protein